MKDVELGRLLELDADAWNSLVIPVALKEDVSKNPEVARRLLEAATIDHWLEVARETIETSEDFATSIGPTREFLKWLGRSALDAFDEDDPSAWAVQRRMIEHAPASDGGFTDARRLFEVMEKDSGGTDLAEVALLVAKGGMTVGDYEAALKYASMAHDIYESLGDEHRARLAARRMGGANLCLKNFNAGMSNLIGPMQTRGSVFGGGGNSVHRSIEDPLESALNEAATVATWAELRTPEWVRCLGAIGERLDDDNAASFMWLHFKLNMKLLLSKSTNPQRDIEVIIRQSGERDLTETPKRALKLYLSKFPDDEWARRQV